MLSVSMTSLPPIRLLLFLAYFYHLINGLGFPNIAMDSTEDEHGLLVCVVDFVTKKGTVMVAWKSFKHASVVQVWQNYQLNISPKSAFLSRFQPSVS
ncbi:hypothetical protein RHMOL_Rhmol02G0046000 [Rhododendron molle]|uniref:Uncharacterized protein n=1 Tax=Rhododendron molle TaxID=49168 RepID=A0ACC0PNA0_RHOML|nr:hypothetical protein RHMOL_Rhmol02G0046000 [Rhododendron molle]